MQSLRDYQNNTQQYKGILNPNQDQVMDRMTDEIIRRRIREYCTYEREKYDRGELWLAAIPYHKIIKIGKDTKGWYVETKCTYPADIIYDEKSKSFYDFCQFKGQPIDKQKGFFIEDIGVYFRWHKHNGSLGIAYASNLESTEGLPETIDNLQLYDCCKKSKRLDVCNKIKTISLMITRDIKISGNDCENIIISPGCSANVTAPKGVKIYHPKDVDEYYWLKDKFGIH